MLEVQGVSLHDGAATALRQVSLTAQPGEVTCLLGRNGVGKTSLLRAVTGAHPISGGSIRRNGTEVSRLPTYDRAKLGIAIAHALAQHIAVMDRGDIVLAGRREELDEQDVRRRLPI